jgi:hypothetical protein
VFFEDRPPRFSVEGSPVCRLCAKLPVVMADDGSPFLPRIVRWAFSLNEGDLLAVSPEEDPAGAWRFLSYGERVWNAVDGCLHPWPHIAELLRRLTAAMGPNGVLRLPEEAEALRGGPILLRVEVDPQGRAFTLEPWGELRHNVERLLEAQYVLPILPGFRVMLPADLLWAFDLDDRELLACKTSLAIAEYEPMGPWKLTMPPEGRSLVELEPGGLLSLPESMRVPSALKPNAQVGLKVFFSDRVTLEVRPWEGLE